ncbi:MAG: hypothetical protein B7Y77_02445 [Bradyrhizobium sp. 35-63-5]|nr:MAG: hypothetical protein B7Y77_02445 [Bradyrhizobium sp. 35-63-5]
MFYSAPSTYGLSLLDLVNKDFEVPGSLIANLGSAVIKDESLLILVRENLAIAEAYGDQRSLKYQLETWPLAHHNQPSNLGIHNRRPLQTHVKAYEDFGPLQSIDKTCIYLSLRSDEINIYHWIFEVLPRLRCLELMPSLRSIPLLIRKPLTEFQLKTLELMGVQNPLLISDGHSLRMKSLIFPSVSCPSAIHPGVTRWLRNALIGKLEKLTKKRRLYVSRSDSTRRIINEELLINRLKPLGFEVLVMTALTPMEQIDAFRAAEIVVMPHGAAGAHMIFAPLDCKLIELQSPQHLNSSYLTLAKGLGQKYGYIFGKKKRNGNYSIEVDQVVSMLERALSHG